MSPLQPWVDDLMTGADTETTGVDTREDRVIQWSVVSDHPRAVPSICTELVNPGVPMAPEATAIHGYTDAMLADAAHPAESLDRLLENLAESVIAQIPIVGMNLAFDLSIMHWEAIRHGIPTLLERTGGVIMPVLDTYVIDKGVDPWRKGSRKLADTDEKGPGIATHYGVELRKEDAHDAVADTMAAVAVMRAIARRFPAEVGSQGLAMLYHRQIGWRAEQQASLQRWLRREKDPQAFCDPCWPICLDLTHPTGKAA